MDRAGEEVVGAEVAGEVEETDAEDDFLDLFFFLTRPLTFMERRPFFLVLVVALAPLVVLVSVAMMDGWIYVFVLLLEGEIEWLEESLCCSQCCKVWWNRMTISVGYMILIYGCDAN